MYVAYGKDKTPAITHSSGLSFHTDKPNKKKRTSGYVTLK
jgi:hypothetical protein